MKKQTLRWILAGLAAGLAFGGCALLVWRYYPQVQSLMEPEAMARFQDKLQSFGILGVGVLLGVQVLQVISGVIPALPIQIGAGVTYGALGGLIICITGIFLGSSLVFVTVKKYGQPLIDRVFPKEKQEKLAFLQDADELGLIVFIVYLIPAMPKDVLTYAAALTPLTFRRFLTITLAARVPTILGNTFASSALLAGNNAGAVVTFCVTGTLGVLCMIFSKRILAWLRARGEKRSTGG